MPAKGAWSHGTVGGAKRHGCDCPHCIEALLNYNEREASRSRHTKPAYVGAAPARCTCGGAAYVDADGDRRCVLCGKLA